MEKYAIGSIRERKENGGIQKYIKIGSPNKWERFYDWKGEIFTCAICHRPTIRHHRFQKFCQELDCLKTARNLPKKAYRGRNRDKERSRSRQHAAYLKQNFPTKYKARMLCSPLHWGRGATDKMIIIIERALGTKCPYCPAILSLTNISLDHKVPLNHNDPSITPERRQELNAEANIHLVCSRCNRCKGNIHHDSFLRLLEFLHTDKSLETVVLARLRLSAVAYNFPRI
jgi:5-methylcytosine-specific restriction endonuclease McrA